jgi:hypothetical protein
VPYVLPPFLCPWAVATAQGLFYFILNKEKFMKDWNHELELLGCKYTYDEIKEILDKFLSSLSLNELKLIRKDIDELFDKKEDYAEANN